MDPKKGKNEVRRRSSVRGPTRPSIPNNKEVKEITSDSPKNPVVPEMNSDSPKTPAVAEISSGNPKNQEATEVSGGSPKNQEVTEVSSGSPKNPVTSGGPKNPVSSGSPKTPVVAEISSGSPKNPVVTEMSSGSQDRINNTTGIAELNNSASPKPNTVKVAASVASINDELIDVGGTSDDSIAPKVKMMEFDDMLIHVGEFGHYQKFLFVFQAPFCIFLAFTTFGQLFMQLYPDVFYCADLLECNIGNMTPFQKQMLTIPFMVEEISCDLTEYKAKDFEAISANEKIAMDQGTCNDKKSCIFNGTHWYSDPPTSFYKHNASLKPDTGSANNPKQKLPSKCDNKNTFVNLRHSTSFSFDYHKKIPPRNGKTLDDCKNVAWEIEVEGEANIFYPTIITEGNWWCNAELYITISQSIFFVGAIVGGFLIGYIADTFGRVPALITANCIGATGGILSTLTTNFYLFSFFRFITGMAFDNCFIMMYILVLEFCGPHYRTMVANLSIAIFFTIGTAILPWIALYIANWRTFGLVVSVPMFISLLAIFLVPESSRWLLSKGKVTRATNILRTFAKVNRKKVDDQIFTDFEEGAQKFYEQISNEAPDPSLKEAFKTPRLRRTFILLVLICSSIALVYDGHNRNILNLANEDWNLFWMFSIASLTEFPADVFMILTLDRFGRRWMAFVSMMLSGIFSFAAATLDGEHVWTPAVILAMFSRFWINVAYNIGLQYASELLPTVIRAQGVNIIHIIGYVAALFSPLIAQIGREHPVLSLCLLGGVSVFGGILSLFLAETLGEDLPNDLAEAEDFGKDQSFWNCPICSKHKAHHKKMKQSEIFRNSTLRASSRAVIRTMVLTGGPTGGNRSVIML